ncbi:MAG: glycosyltransferase family 2 protein [Bacteroidota bacterium]
MIIAWLVLGFLALRFGVAALNVLSNPRLGSHVNARKAGRVSILIPARNEAHNLPQLFAQLEQLSPTPFEIIVLNDHSEDETEEILREKAMEWPLLSYLNGKELPEGWLGKNWACHQLAEVAEGDQFLFLDADIAELKPEILAHTSAWLSEKNLSLLSLFPDQIMHSQGEQIVVPIMHHLLLSLLPLSWIYHLPFPSMAAANGQFMLFDGTAYRQFRFHERVKHIIVEDIRIMQLVKSLNLKGMTLLGNGWIRCRMYGSWQTGVEGFSKNLLSGFGNSIPGLLLYLFLTVFGWGWLIVYGVNWQLMTAFGLLAGIRIAISALARQSIVRNLILHPFQMASLLLIGFRSIYQRLSGNSQWKGRNVHVSQS